MQRTPRIIPRGGHDFVIYLLACGHEKNRKIAEKKKLCGSTYEPPPQDRCRFLNERARSTSFGHSTKEKRDFRFFCRGSAPSRRHDERSISQIIFDSDQLQLV